jgi:CRISPR/Cas system-associated exonuclease Cas4 (RecB family)
MLAIHRTIGKALQDKFKGMVFEEVSHTYTKEGKGLTPVSTFIKNFVKPFVAYRIAPGTARKEGISVEQVLKNWDEIRDEACEAGTRVHDFGERYVIDRYKVPSKLKFDNVVQHLEKGEKLNNKELALIKFWNEKPEHYVPIALELRMYCVEIGIAGTADIILLDTRDSTLVIADYKTNKDLFKQHENQKLLDIFRDRDDTPFTHYEIQLSSYQILLEKKGYKVSRKMIVYLKEDGQYEIYDTEDLTSKIYKYFENQKSYVNSEAVWQLLGI